MENIILYFAKQTKRRIKGKKNRESNLISQDIDVDNGLNDMLYLHIQAMASVHLLYAAVRSESNNNE